MSAELVGWRLGSAQEEGISYIRTWGRSCLNLVSEDEQIPARREGRMFRQRNNITGGCVT